MRTKNQVKLDNQWKKEVIRSFQGKEYYGVRAVRSIPRQDAKVFYATDNPRVTLLDEIEEILLRRLKRKDFFRKIFGLRSIV